jgi:predicted metalloprotease with PDZ domain
MEEGLATYIEPIARVQTGELQARQIWQDMVHGMPQGEPGPSDQGLDRTHTWGRTYWGGALFCLAADVEIRRQTGNRKGLQDALRAVVAEGGTIDHEWTLEHALEIGDRATETYVLTRQYAAWKDSPSPVDLEKLWNELGIRTAAGAIEFVPTAPLAGVREAITANATAPHANPVRQP